jgi:parvulin-like peptidyl-prolyl isomerase
MKRQISIAVVVVLAAAALGQMASHAPTSLARTSATPAPSAPPMKLAGKAVARVNGAVLTDRDLTREMFAIFPYARQHSGGFPKTLEPEIRQGAMKMIIFEELVYQEAQRRNLTVTPTRLARAEADFRKQYSDDDFQRLLKSDFKGSRQVFREKIQRSLLIQDLLKSEVQTKSAVSETELKAYYDKNPHQFERPETFAIQSISILPPGNASPEVLKDAGKKAEDIYRQAKATKSYEEFGLLAEKVSDDDYRVNMGDHKTVDKSKLPPQIVTAAEKMKPGEVSELIVVGNNYTFFRLNGHNPAGKVNLQEVKQQLRADLQKQKSERLRTSLDQRLRKGAKIEVM